MKTSSRFNNASLEVDRSETEETFRGTEKTGETSILSCRCDAQESGQTLQRKRDYFQTGDVLVYPEKDVTPVEAGDEATLEMDDGRTLTGNVEEVELLSNSLLISL